MRSAFFALGCVYQVWADRSTSTCMQRHWEACADRAFMAAEGDVEHVRATLAALDDHGLDRLPSALRARFEAAKANGRARRARATGIAADANDTASLVLWATEVHL